jgi:hypothetical protein
MKYLLLSIVFVLSAWSLEAQRATAGKTDIRSELTVFPNPAHDFISVEDNTDQVNKVAVYSMIGRRLKEFEFSKGAQYPIGDLPRGMYLVQVLDRNEQILKTQKIDKR